MADFFTRPDDFSSLIVRPTIRIVVVVIGLMLCVGAATAKEPVRAFPDNDAFHDVAVVGTISDRFEIYNPHSVDHLNTIRELGFTQVILDWPNLSQAAAERGLDVVLANWWTIDTEVSTIEQHMATAMAKRSDRLVGISMMDEPERNSPDTPFTYYQALYGDLKKHMSSEMANVRLEMSHWGPLASWTEEEYTRFIPLYQSTDCMRLMPYPDLRDGPLSEVFYQMMRSRHIMRLADREVPQLVILQTWVLPENPKLPSIPELRVMAYQAILSGAETVSFFSYEPDVWAKTPGFTEGFRELMSELTLWTKRYRGQRVETTLDRRGILTSYIGSESGSRVRLRINTNREFAGDLEGLTIQTALNETSTQSQTDDTFRRCSCEPAPRVQCRPAKRYRPKRSK